MARREGHHLYVEDQVLDVWVAPDHAWPGCPRDNEQRRPPREGERTPLLVH